MCESVPQLRYQNPHLRVVVNTRAAEDAPQRIKFKTGGVGVGGTPQSISVGLYNCCAHCWCVCLCAGDSWRQVDVAGLSVQEIRELVSKFDWTTQNV